MHGKALIFSAPSGSGKTTIVHHLLKVFPQLQFSISATTRKPRENEIDGTDYYFLSTEQFKSSEFVESEEVYPGKYYGTLKPEVERIWAKGGVVVFDVDVKGGVNLKNYFGEKALAVFVKAPDIDVIRKRLIDRGTETIESLATRMDRIKFEMTFEKQFDEVLINDDLPRALLESEKTVNEFLKA